MNKDEIRREILKDRALLTKEYIDGASREIFQKAREYIKGGESLFVYVAMENEVQTELFFKEYKNICVPKCYKGGLMKAVGRFSRLEKTPFGPMEPVDGQEMESIGTAIVPGLAFSNNRDRIGYGAGYYDRFFARYPEIFKIAVCFDFQIRDDFLPDSHDIKPDCVITERRIILK